MTDGEMTGKRNRYGWVFYLIVFLLGLGLGGGGVLYVVKTYPSWLGLPQTAEQAQSEVESLLAEVSQFMALPTDEQPTVATVTDVEKVKSQSFFRNAQNGDRVIIYSTAKRAILYRQAEKKIIEVGSISINNQQQPSQPPQTDEQPVATPTPVPTPTPVATPTPVPTVTPTPTPGQGGV